MTINVKVQPILVSHSYLETSHLHINLKTHSTSNIFREQDICLQVQEKYLAILTTKFHCLRVQVT